MPEKSNQTKKNFKQTARFSTGRSVLTVTGLPTFFRLIF